VGRNGGERDFGSAAYGASRYGSRAASAPAPADDYPSGASGDWAAEESGGLSEKVSSAVETARERVGHAGERVRDAGSSLADAVREHPVPAAVAALGLGWFILSARGGSLTGSRDPSTRESDPRYGRSAADRDQDDRSALVEARHRAGQIVDQAQQKASELAGQVKESAGHVVDTVQERVGTWSSEARFQARRAGGEFQRMFHDNPLAVAATVAAVGVIAGLALPETRSENRLMGEMRDQFVDQAKQSAQELGARAKHVAQEAAHSALDTARREAEEEGLTATAGEGGTTASS
jgi:ElaB/YqjD/DUF883 family membrane-anchored ribosome-binding protein